MGLTKAELKKRERERQKIHEEALEIFGKQQAEKLKNYHKFYISNSADLTFLEIGSILDEFYAGTETTKLMHNVEEGVSQEIQVTLRRNRQYMLTVTYLSDTIQFDIKFVKILQGVQQPTRGRTRERDKLIKKQAERQAETVKKVQGELDKGKDCAIKVVCCETGKLYGSIMECAEDLGLASQIVCKYLLGEAGRFSTNGYTFRLYNDENYNVSKMIKDERLKVKCIENNMIFENAVAAKKWLSKTVGGTQSYFYEAVNRPEDLTCGGYHWMYVDDNGNRVQK